MPPSVAKEDFLTAPQKDPSSLSSESSVASSRLGSPTHRSMPCPLSSAHIPHGEADEVCNCTLDKTLAVSQFLLVTL